jgi:hypothetical protein
MPVAVELQGLQVAALAVVAMDIRHPLKMVLPIEVVGVVAGHLL